jgi:hypothetical protein
MTHYNRILSLMLWALTFAAAGSAARYASRYLIETRYIIALFCLIAIILEFVIWPAMGRQRNLGALLLNCTAAIAAIVTTKWILEGIHPWLR